jgi:hypothetical protein
MKIHYTYDGSGDSFDSAYEIESLWDLDDLEWIAEECADDFHHNHDGWERSWPVTFTLWDEQGNSLGDYEVERDVEPVFSAYRKDKQETK